MIVEHNIEVRALCPVDDLPDIYRCIVRTTRTIPVEDILAAVKTLAGEKLFQEAITEKLHRLLACEVETIGWHSGVLTRCIAGGI